MPSSSPTTSSHTTPTGMPSPSPLSRCAVCSTPAPHKCARCKSVSYCSPAHQKQDWPAHKTQCPRLAQKALSAVFEPCDEELLLRITTCLAQNGYHKEVGIMVQLNKAFWWDEQIWDAFKDVPGARGKTRLIYAAGKGWLERMTWLCERGARINTTFELGVNALWVAVESGSTETAKALLARGADVNTRSNEDGATALTLACGPDGSDELVHLLLAAGAKVDAIRTDTGATALMMASAKGFLERMKALIRAGANVNYGRAEDGYTGLMVACQDGQLEAARELIASGAKVDARKTDTGTTPLMVAAQYSRADIATLLLDNGADVNATRFNSGVTALHINASKGCVETGRVLLERGAEVNKNRGDGITPLITASGCGHLDMARLLLDAGADKTLKSNRGGTAYSEILPGKTAAALRTLLKSPKNF